MKVKPVWVVFDIGGVLLDYRSAIRDVAKHLSVEEQLLSDKLFTYMEDGELGKNTFDHMWEDVLKSMNKHHEHENVLYIWNDVKRFVLDTRLLLKQLHSHGYKIALFTNSWVGMLQYDLDHVQEFHLANPRIESWAEKLRKPDVRFYRLLEERVGASGNEILFMDDTLENIETANEIGWQTFHYMLGVDEGKSSNDILRYHLLEQ